MPAIIHESRSDAGLDMFLGANPRARTPAEDKYHFARLMGPPQGVDLTKPMLLFDGIGRDLRQPVANQGQLGSCTAFAEMGMNFAVSNVVTGAGVAIHPGWLYEQSRKKEGSWPNDAGAYEADALDIAMAGAPLFSAAPYVEQAGYDYSALTPDPATNFIARHMPFYPADGNVLENMWFALSQGQPVGVAMAWLRPFFSPQGGKLPDGANPADVAGGHEIMCWGVVPGFVLCANQWSPGWSADAPSLGFTMRPGDFAIPWDYFTDPNSIIWELQAVTAVPIPPKPTTCRSASLALAQPVLDGYAAKLARSPRSTMARYGQAGAKAVVAALEGMPV